MEKENIVEKIGSAIDAAKKPKLIAKFLGLISYLGILCVIPIILKSKSNFIRFHTRQGMVLFISEIIFTLIWIIPFVGWFIGFVGWIICFIFSLVGIIKAITGQEWKMPVLHRFTKKVRF